MMLNLYNSLSKKKEEIKIDKDDVRIYLCGPTVQSSPHLGHGRSAVVFDFFIRYLKYHNYSVLFARNITDIDDKIIKSSKCLEINATFLCLALEHHFERFDKPFLFVLTFY